MDVSKERKLSYVPELDGMRGFAILAVMCFHANVPFLMGGFIGVDVFFVLSGFLITSLIINEYDATSKLNLKNFYMRRLLRLGPALLLLLLIFSLFSIIFLSKDEAQSNLIDTIISLFYMSNWARALSIHPPDYLGHTWSLSIEEQFYILWPLTLLVLLRIFNNRWTVAFVVFLFAMTAWLLRIYLIYSGSSFERLYNGLDTRADSLMIGCVFGIILSSDLLNNRIKNILSKWLSILSPFSIFCLIFISVGMRWKNPQMYYWVFFAIEIFTAVLLLHLFINNNSLIHKLLSMRWIVWVGSISYGLYLWHYPIYRILYSLSYRGIELITYGAIVTFMISAFSFYMLEKPFLKIKKNYSVNITPEKANVFGRQRSPLLRRYAFWRQ